MSLDDKIYASIEDQAKAEVDAEDHKEAVKELKKLYVQLKKANTIVDNLEREIADYVEQAKQGN